MSLIVSRRSLIAEIGRADGRDPRTEREHDPIAERVVAVHDVAAHLGCFRGVDLLLGPVGGIVLAVCVTLRDVRDVDVDLLVVCCEARRGLDDARAGFDSDEPRVDPVARHIQRLRIFRDVDPEADLLDHAVLAEHRSAPQDAARAREDVSADEGEPLLLFFFFFFGRLAFLRLARLLIVERVGCARGRRERDQEGREQSGSGP